MVFAVLYAQPDEVEPVLDVQSAHHFPLLGAVGCPASAKWVADASAEKLMATAPAGRVAAHRLQAQRAAGMVNSTGASVAAHRAESAFSFPEEPAAARMVWFGRGWAGAAVAANRHQEVMQLARVRAVEATTALVRVRPVSG